MVKNLTDWLVALLELLEAEWETIRHGAFKLGLGLAWLWLAVTLLLGAAAFLVWALWLGLTAVLAPVWAALLCGVALLLGAGAALWRARSAGRG